MQPSVVVQASDAAGPGHRNAALVGKPLGRRQIDTPALVLDLEAFEENIRTMAGIGLDRGVGLRPHGKTHKCREIARRQMAAGAIGICCAKVSEAEALAGGDVDRILITAPVSDRRKIDRLLAVRQRIRNLMVVVDDVEGAKKLSAALASSDRPLEVLVDIDVGQHRTGVTSLDEALQLGRLVDSLPGLALVGIQGYAGQLQHVENYDERRRLSESVLKTLSGARDALRSQGLGCDIVTGSGTGTHDIDSRSGVFTELQVGSYIFGDAHYDEVVLTENGSCRFKTALFVATQVVSNRHSGFVTADAGSKCFALDGRSPVIIRGAPKGSSYQTSGDQFGRIILPDGSPRIEVGSRVEFTTPHCDPTVNLYDWIVCARGETIETMWKIEARGATS